jgi:hypothetical protein
MRFKKFRILILLAVLIAVAGMTHYQQRTITNWLQPLSVEIYPIHGDDSPQTANYIDGLTEDVFRALPAFFAEEAERYRIPLNQVIRLQLNSPLKSLPPKPPSERRWYSVMAWSMHLRYWVYRQTDSSTLGSTVIRLFLIYHAPRDNIPLEHSLGLSKGLIGVVHVFAEPEQEAQNNVVIAHEVLHTLGASDKYEPGGYPQFPEGFGDPAQEPLYPQQWAEIMGGRLALSDSIAEIPSHLNRCLVGPMTAREIRWLRD